MSDLELKIEAKSKLSTIELQQDLATTKENFASLWILKAPELKQIVTPEELKGLVDAIKAGTASNNQLTKFVNVANKILGII
jgi:hypothetical protein